MMPDTTINHSKELTAFHICPIIQILEQNFALNDNLYFNNIYLIKNDSLFTFKNSDIKYIETKVNVISKSEYKDFSLGELSLFCKFSKIEVNEYGDLNINTSFQINGHTSNIMGFLEMKFGKKNHDVLPIYRLLHYSSFSTE